MIFVPHSFAAVRAVEDGHMDVAQLREMIDGAALALSGFIGAAGAGHRGSSRDAIQVLTWIELVASELTRWRAEATLPAYQPAP